MVFLMQTLGAPGVSSVSRALACVFFFFFLGGGGGVVFFLGFFVGVCLGLFLGCFCGGLGVFWGCFAVSWVFEFSRIRHVGWR